MGNAIIFLLLVLIGVYLMLKLEEKVLSVNQYCNFNAKIFSTEVVNNMFTIVVQRQDGLFRTYERIYHERFECFNLGDDVFITEDEECKIYHYLTKQTFTFYDANS